MATIGIINIGIKASTDGLAKGLNKGQVAVKGFASQIASISPKLSTVGSSFLALGAAMGTGALARGLANVAKGALDTIDATGDLAQRAGTTAEAFTALRYAVKLTGSETETLDGALLKMNANLGDAAVATGTGTPAQKALEGMGLSAKALVKLDPAAAFSAIAGGFQKLKGPAAQSAAAMDIFGKTGIGLLNTLNAGPAKIAALEAEAKKLGLTFSSLDADKVGAANDAIDRVKGAFGGLVNTLTIKLAPALESWGAKIVDGLPRITSAVATVTDAFGSAFSGTILPGFQAIGSALVEMPARLESAFGLPGQAILAGLQGAVANVGYAFRNLPDLFGVAALVIQEKIINVGEYITALGANFGQLGTYLSSNWYKVVLDVFNGIGSSIINVGKNLDKLIKALIQFAANPTKGFEVNWTPLLDGFKRESSSLPTLIKPQLTSLQGEIDAVFGRIATKEAARLQPAALAASAAPAVKKSAADQVDAKEGLKHAAAVELGSKEAYSAVLKARGMGEPDALKDIKASSKTTANATARLPELIERMNRTLSNMSPEAVKGI
jgi:hypothetical protein